MGDIPPPQSSPPKLPSPPSEMEAKHYYDGLPSAPVLVARTSTTPWKKPTGPEADQAGKELRPASHPILGEIWRDTLAPKAIELLDSMNVKWTSLDIVRIGIAEEYFAPVILWIGVIPASLSGRDGVDAAFKCRKLLVDHDITDVEVEIRESVVKNYWGSAAYFAPS